MREQFQGKIVLVTGGGSGIGRATALAFGKEKAKVVIADLSVEGGEKTVGMIKDVGGEAIFVKADVSQQSEVKSLILKVVEYYGRIDCAFNNAGIGGDLESKTADATEDNWNRVIDINLKGVWLCMKYEIPQMLKQGNGAIVNTSSGAGLWGTPGISAYSASKHGIIGLTKTAALEYATAGIRINAVCPGPIFTEAYQAYQESHPDVESPFTSIVPMKRFGGTEDIAAAVVWLCSDAALYVTGIAMPVDGGMSAQGYTIEK